MSKTYQRILIHPEAATKPAPGAPCNGCGVCCLLEPCPLGMVLSGRRHGACVAVRWSEPLRQYRCGALSAPQEVLKQVLPGALSVLVPGLSRALAFVAGRWIAVNLGCDSSLELQEPRQRLAARDLSGTIQRGNPCDRS